MVMDKFNPTPYWACGYVSILGLKLIRVGEMTPGVMLLRLGNLCINFA